MSPRPTCLSCLRPVRACLCACVQPVHSQVQLLVLQHPMEVGHAKNTARLLHLCLPGSRLEVGEHWPADTLQDLLYAPWPQQALGSPVHTVLLYPPTPADPQLPLVQPPLLPTTWLEQPQHLRLVVIDGTWRKSRKMLYQNPALQRLPRLPLEVIPAGRYAIRKAHAPGQLSTFEASALALAQLQAWGDQHPSWIALQQAFDAAISWHQQLQSQAATPLA